MEQRNLHQIVGTHTGQILVGKYRVDRVLGVGGMGTVFAAHHLQLDTRVAVKVMRPSLLTNPDAVACFTREARAAIRMSNKHVTRVFDVGTLTTGAPYMVMEFLEGADLGTLLQKHGRFSVETAIDFLLQACEGIAEAHSLGIVHRDLKPANLFCIQREVGRPVIKVLDFGISKAMEVGSPSQPLRPTPAVAGTPSYMSPEQVDAPWSVDGRTDIWALGVILYEVLTGKKPFRGESMADVSVEIATSRPPPLQSLVPDLPDQLGAIIDVCLTRDREKRYRNVAQLAWALLPFGPRRARAAAERIADILQVTGTPAGQPSVSGSFEASGDHLESPEPSPNDEPSVLAPPRSSSGKRMIAMAAGAGIVGALFLAYVSLDGRGGLRSVGLGSGGPRSVGVGSAGVRAVGVRAVDVPLPTSVALQQDAPRTTLVVPSTVGAGARDIPVIAAPAFSEHKAVPTDQGLTPPSLQPDGPDMASHSMLSVARTPARVSATSLGGAAARNKSNCNPTFDLDEKGRKHFKPECLAMGGGAKTSAATRPPGCDPNFELDEQGRKHFKRECFLGAPR